MLIGDLVITLIRDVNFMEKLFLLEPEVAGGLGEQTVITNFDVLKRGNTKIPNITKLEYIFDDWLGDDLIESTPCFIVTEDLASKIKSSDLTGYSFEDVLISKSDLFRQIHKDDIALPNFFWLKLQGSTKLDENWKVKEWSGQDFCSDERGRLIVTEKCLKTLKQSKINNCNITELS